MYVPWGPPVLQPPNPGMFTALNQSASNGTIAGHPNGVMLSMPANGSFAPICAIMPVPSSTPWSVAAQVLPGFLNSGNASAGLLLYESSSSKIVMHGPNNGHYCQQNTLTLPSTFGVTNQTGDCQLPLSLLKVLNDGTHLTYYVSFDGVNFIQFVQRTITQDFTSGPTHYGLFLCAGTGFTSAYAVCTHWVTGTS